MPQRLTIREWLLATALAAGLVAAAYLTAPSAYDSLDYLRFHEPMKTFGAQALREGRLPLWNPHVNLGRPHLADLQAGVLYPTTLLYVVAPVKVAFFATAALHALLGLVGMVLLAGHLGVERRVAWVVGGAFMFSGPVATTVQTGIVEGMQTIAWMPVVLLLAVRLQDQRSVGRVAALAAALALQMVSGHVQYAWIGGVAMALFLVGRRLERPFAASARAGALDLALVAVAALWAALLAAVQLLPFAELAAHGNRGERSLAFASAWSMPWADWATLFRPVKATFVVNWVDNLYPGLLLVLAGAVALTRLKADRNVRGLLLAALVAALIAAGDRTPVFRALYHLLPGVSLFRLHARATVVVVLCLALAAALFFSRPDEHRGRASVAMLAGALLVGAAAIVAVELRVPAPDRSWFEAAARLAALAVAAILIAACLRPGGPPVGAGALALGLAALVAADLAQATVKMKRNLPAVAPLAAEKPVVGELGRRGLLAPGTPPPRVALPYPFVRENAGMIHGWSSHTGYLALALDRVWIYLHAALGREPPALLNAIPSNEIYHPGPFPYRSMSLVVGYDRRTRRVVFNQRPDPRAYLTAAARPVAGGWRQAIAEMRAGHDFHRVALVEETIPSLPAQPAAPDGTAACAAHITRFAPERIELATDCPLPALLVVAEPWYPGWTAAVDGAPAAPCLPVNAWMRGAPVPAGKHGVVLAFRSRHLRLGALISALAAAGLVAAALRARKSPTQVGVASPVATHESA